MRLQGDKGCGVSPVGQCTTCGMHCVCVCVPFAGTSPVKLCFDDSALLCYLEHALWQQTLSTLNVAHQPRTRRVAPLPPPSKVHPGGGCWLLAVSAASWSSWVMCLLHTLTHKRHPASM